MKTINKLYHATLHENDAYVITEGGFDTKITYLCSEIHHAAEFLQLIHGEGEYYVVEVDATKLDVENLEESTDHDPAFYSKDLKSYVYLGWIDEDLISDNIHACNIWRA